MARYEALGDAVSDILFDATRAAFDEDKAMIESQQQRIETAASGRPLLAFRADGAVLATRRLIERRLKEEVSA